MLQPQGLPKDIHVSFVGTTKSHALRQEMVAQLQPQVTCLHRTETQVWPACVRASLQMQGRPYPTQSQTVLCQKSLLCSSAIRVCRAVLAALQGYLFTEAAHNRSFELIERSTFTLAPRGSGSGSFRMYEALQLGSIPIFIWGERPQRCYLRTHGALDDFVFGTLHGLPCGSARLDHRQ